MYSAARAIVIHCKGKWRAPKYLNLTASRYITMLAQVAISDDDRVEEFQIVNKFKRIEINV